MKFRLTVGEDGSAMGKQKVLYMGTAENAFEFVKNYLSSKSVYVQNYIIKNAWVDAGADTLPIAVMNFKL